MTDPILPWPVRHPALLDDTGAPVFFLAPAAAHADQPSMPQECPIQHTGEPTPQHPTDAAIGYRLSAIGYCHRTAQIVTPSAALRELLTRCLRALDLTAAETDDPALVLLDLAAPDALAHCRALRQQHPELPIVVLTPLIAEHLSAWQAGANAVVPIPFDVLDLHATIRILLVQLHTHASKVVPPGHEDTAPW